MVLATQVEDAVVSTLQTWMATYLGWIDRLLGHSDAWLPLPQSYVVTNDVDRWAEDALPSINIGIPGTLEPPRRSGDGMVRVCWDLRVAVFVSANDRPSTERLAKYYGGALRAILAQKQNLGGIAVGTHWLDEAYDFKVADRDQRGFGSAMVRFSVETRKVVNTRLSPATPATDPQIIPPDWTVVNKLTPVAITESLT